MSQIGGDGSRGPKKQPGLTLKLAHVEDDGKQHEPVEEDKMSSPNIKPCRVHYSEGTIVVREKKYEVEAADMLVVEVLGMGNFGVVEKVRHAPSNTLMAVRHLNKAEKIQLVDPGIIMCVNSCPHLVQFYGVPAINEEIWICMELMDMSLDKFYKMAHKKGRIPEEILGKITFSITKGLHYLHQELKVIHRNVKPSNMFVSRSGEVKLGDYTLGYCSAETWLTAPSRSETVWWSAPDHVESGGDSQNTGYKSYMAPERFTGEAPPGSKSDVWSLGISVVEMATGKYPYAGKESTFERIEKIIQSPSPKLSEGEFSSEFGDFIDKCLNKTWEERPEYLQLLEHSFLNKYTEKDINIAAFITPVLEEPQPP